MRHPFIGGLVVSCALVVGPAVARADRSITDDVGDLLDVDVGDTGIKWRAIEYPTGAAAYAIVAGGCVLNMGAVDCEVKAYDVVEQSVTLERTFQILDAMNDQEGLGNTIAELHAYLEEKAGGDVSGTPFTEHRFEKPITDAPLGGDWAHWDPKTKSLSILHGTGKRKKVIKKVKSPKLTRGLTLTSAAVWGVFDENGGSSVIVLRLHGDGDEAMGDALAVVPLPGNVMGGAF